MGRVIINGTTAPIPQPMEIDFDPVRGLILSQEFISAGDNLAGLANFYRNANIAFKWKRSPVKSSLVVTLSGGQAGIADTAQPNWQLLGNEIQKSIFESGIALAGIAAFPDLIADVKKGWNFLQEGDALSEDDLSNSLDPAEVVYYDQLIDFLMRGQTHFAQGQYVLKRTISISNFYSTTVPGEDLLESLITMGSMVSIGVGFSMPVVMQAKLNSIPIPTSHTGYLWSWRQLPSTMITGAQNRVEVNTEWWWEEWSTNLYNVA